MAFGLLAVALGGAGGIGPLEAQEAPRRGTGALAYRDLRLLSATMASSLEMPSMAPTTSAASLPRREWQVYQARENPNSRINYGYRYDPKYRREYSCRLQVACTEADGARRAFVVHYQQPQDEALAIWSGHLLARLYWISRDYLGRQAATDRFTSVFLARGGTAGGEEAEGNIYLHAVEEPRAPAEWVRELAHEYGHVILPPVGEYTEPEKWANGYLGERLLMKWLLRDNAETKVWTEPIDAAAYVARQVEPLRTLFNREGPESPLARRRDAEGMNFFIGQVLSVEALYGPIIVRDALANLKGTDPQALVPALGAALRARQAQGIALSPQAVIPEQTEREPGGETTEMRARKVAYRVFLPAGSWSLGWAGEVPEGTKVTLDGAGLSPETPAHPARGAWGPARVSADGWRLLEIQAPPERLVTLRELTLTAAR